MTTDTLTAFKDMFGYGWRTKAAEALGLTKHAISQTKPGAPSYAALTVALEFMEVTPVAKWPERWKPLADQLKAKRKKEAQS